MKPHPQLLVPSLLLTVNRPFILFLEPQLGELWPSGSTEWPLCRGAHSGALQADWLSAGQATAGPSRVLHPVSDPWRAWQRFSATQKLLGGEGRRSPTTGSIKLELVRRSFGFLFFFFLHVDNTSVCAPHTTTAPALHHSSVQLLTTACRRIISIVFDLLLVPYKSHRIHPG